MDIKRLVHQDSYTRHLLWPGEQQGRPSWSCGCTHVSSTGMRRGRGRCSVAAPWRLWRPRLRDDHRALRFEHRELYRWVTSPNRGNGRRGHPGFILRKSMYFVCILVVPCSRSCILASKGGYTYIAVLCCILVCIPMDSESASQDTMYLM